MGAAKWYVVTSDGEKGPVSSARVRELVAEGRLSERSLLRREDREQPVRAGAIRGLFPAAAEGVAPAEDPAAAETAPAARGGTRTPRIERRPRTARWGRFRDPHPLGLVAVVALALLVLVQLALTLLAVRDPGMQETVLAETVDPDALEPAELTFLLLGGVGGLVRVAVVITFLLWLWRARKNLSALGAPRLRWGQGWVVAAFLIPFFNLFAPYLVIAEVWRASDPTEPPRLPGLVLAWMLAFDAIVLGNFLLDPLLILDLTPSTRLLLGTALTVTVSVLAVLVILGIDARQRATYARVAAEDA